MVSGSHFQDKICDSTKSFTHFGEFKRLKKFICSLQPSTYAPVLFLSNYKHFYYHCSDPYLWINWNIRCLESWKMRAIHMILCKKICFKCWFGHYNIVYPSSWKNCIIVEWCQWYCWSNSSIPWDGKGLYHHRNYGFNRQRNFKELSTPDPWLYCSRLKH